MRLTTGHEDPEGADSRPHRGRFLHASSDLARPCRRPGGHRSGPPDSGSDGRHHRDHLERHLRQRSAPDRGDGTVHVRRRRDGSRADGDRARGRGRGHRGEAGRPGRRPLQHLLRHLLDVLAGAAVPVRDHAEPRSGDGASLFGYTKLYGQVPGGQAEFLRVPFGNTLPIKVPDAPLDDRFVYLSDVLPTAWQAVQYAGIPEGGSVLVLGLGPIGDMATRIAKHLGAAQVIAADVVPERLARARRNGVTVIDSTTQADVVARVRDLTDGRGPDAVIDAVGMEAHGSPLATIAQKAT